MQGGAKKRKTKQSKVQLNTAEKEKLNDVLLSNSNSQQLNRLNRLNQLNQLDRLSLSQVDLNSVDPNDSIDSIDFNSPNRGPLLVKPRPRVDGTSRR